MTLSQYARTGVLERVHTGRQWIRGIQQYRSISVNTGAHLLRYGSRKDFKFQVTNTMSEEASVAGQKVKRRRAKTKKKGGVTLSSATSHGGVVKSTRLVEKDTVSIEIEVTECGEDAEVDVLWYVASPCFISVHVCICGLICDILCIYHQGCVQSITRYMAVSKRDTICG